MHTRFNCSESLLWIGVLVTVLAGCTLLNAESDDADLLSESALHADLVAHLAKTQTAHTVALDVWDRVIEGETVSCQQAIVVPPAVALAPEIVERYPQAGTVQTELNTAIRSLRDAADLWNIECADSRDYVPLSMAHEGRAAALDAGEPLDTASTLLDAWVVTKPD